MSNPSDYIIQQLHVEISKAADSMSQVSQELKDIQGEMIVLKSELILRGDRICQLLMHQELLAEENNALRRQLADLRYRYQRDFQGDL